MTTDSLRPDCARCAALCCVGLAFDRSALFAYDKPAGEPCRNLGEDHRCRIHEALDARGFGGCVAYDCLGAGQAVVQGVFGGRSWLQDRALLGPMMTALAAIRETRELVALLRQATGLDLPAEAREALGALEARLMPDGGWTAADLARGGPGEAAEAARRFLKTLRPFVRPAAAG